MLSDLFRTIEGEIGTNEFCILVFRALKSALRQYKIETKEEFIVQYMRVFEMVKATKPRYAILMDSFYRFLDFYEKQKGKKSVDELIDEVERIKVDLMLDTKRLIQASQKLDIKDKNILIYDHSHTVQKILSSYADRHKHFTIVIAEQDIEKTEDNIEFCHKLKVSYKVVPSYMLSHIEQTVDMLFFGAVTYQENGQFVMDPGSKSMISEFTIEKRPIYICMTTNKMSLWHLEEHKPEIYSKPHLRKHHALQEIEFERLKFSHDRVPLDLVTGVITEKGLFTPKEFDELFKDMQKKRISKGTK